MPKYILVATKHVNMKCIIEAEDYEQAYEMGLNGMDFKTGEDLKWEWDDNSLENDWSFDDAYEYDDNLKD